MELASQWLSKNHIPGQFVEVKVKENGTDPLLRIPLAIHAFTKHSIKLLYKVVGSGTILLSQKRKGETINLLGPLGNGFSIKNLAKKKNAAALLIGGGHGIAPLYSLAQTLAKNKTATTCFLGSKNKKHYLVCQVTICSNN